MADHGGADLWLKLLACACVEECPQPVAPAGVAQFAQRLGFDLPDALAGHGEVLADFFQRVLAAILQPEAHLDDLLFARAERLEDLGCLLAQIEIDHGFARRRHAPVDDEVAEMRFFLFTHRRFERDRFLRDPQHLADLADRQFQPAAEFFGGRFATQLLLQLTLRPHQLVDRLDHVDRNADGPGLIGDGPRDGLPHPPGRVGGELIAALVVELIHGLHQADVAFLNQVEELQSRDWYIASRWTPPGGGWPRSAASWRLGFVLAAIDDLQRAAQFDRRGAAFFFELLHPRCQLAQFSLAVASVQVRPVGRFAFFRPALGSRDLLLQRFELLDRRAQLPDQMPSRR